MLVIERTIPGPMISGGYRRTFFRLQSNEPGVRYSSDDMDMILRGDELALEQLPMRIQCLGWISLMNPPPDRTVIIGMLATLLVFALVFGYVRLAPSMEAPMLWKEQPALESPKPLERRPADSIRQFCRLGESVHCGTMAPALTRSQDHYDSADTNAPGNCTLASRTGGALRAVGRAVCARAGVDGGRRPLQPETRPSRQCFATHDHRLAEGA